MMLRRSTMGLLRPLRPQFSVTRGQLFRSYAVPPTQPAGSNPTPPPLTPAVRPKKRHSFKKGLFIGLLVGIAVGLYDKGVVKLESSATVQPPTSCEPFEKTVELDGTKFTCLGVGVRTVSFLSFHVYAVGIYVADDDIAKCKTALLAANASMATLADENASIDVIDQVLRAGVRLAVRITPVRNTEFSHLRDGFVRSIMNHPMFKELNDDAFGEGLNDIKRTFGRKRKAPKGDTIYMVRTITGGLRAQYLSKDGTFETLGEVDNINLARVFFLQYLSGKNPNSPSARDDSVKGLLEIVHPIAVT